MKRPYRVIVWGPGIVGTAVLREILKKPELELVGVLAFNPDKNGKDVGEYLGMAPIGMHITTDQEQIMKTPADVVLYSPNMSAKVDLDSEATNIVCRFLESGKNVVTSAAWWYPEVHSKELKQKLENACKKGGTCLHGTGVNPGWLVERVMPTLAGVSTRISHIKIQEISNNRTIESADMMRGIGYGQELSETPWIHNVGDRGYTEAIAQACAVLGVKMERIESEKKYFVAREDIDLIPMKVRKGTKAGINYFYHAIVDGKPFITLEELWYVDTRDLPKGAPDWSDYYTITIEGEPVSVKCNFQLMASVEKNLAFREGDRTLPAYYATATPMIQAIPIVCGAKPGIVYAHTFANFVPDLRDFKSPLIVR